jgi:hypothetical protein
LCVGRTDFSHRASAKGLGSSKTSGRDGHPLWLVDKMGSSTAKSHPLRWLDEYNNGLIRCNAKIGIQRMKCVKKYRTDRALANDNSSRLSYHKTTTFPTEKYFIAGGEGRRSGALGAAKR